MTKEYLDLKVDFMFKQLFGQPSRKHITIAFLNDVLGRSEIDKITDLTFENTEYAKEKRQRKNCKTRCDRINNLRRTNKCRNSDDQSS